MVGLVVVVVVVKTACIEGRNVAAVYVMAGMVLVVCGLEPVYEV